MLAVAVVAAFVAGTSMTFLMEENMADAAPTPKTKILIVDVVQAAPHPNMKVGAFVNGEVRIVNELNSQSGANAVVPLNLPDGATITKATCHVAGSVGNSYNYVCDLYRSDFGVPNANLTAVFASTGVVNDGPNNEVVAISTGVVNEIVDNTQFIYYLNLGTRNPLPSCAATFNGCPSFFDAAIEYTPAKGGKN